MNQNRVPFFDSFRGVAAVCIAIFHFTLFYSMNFREMFEVDMKKLGWLTFGVQMFYIISGFLVYRSSLNYTNGLTFVKKRVVRLYPSFWLSLILIMLFVTIFPHKVYSFTLWQLLANFTMFAGFLGVKVIDGSHWYLIPELMFYFFMGGVVLLKLQRKILYVCGLWLVLILLNSFRPSFVEYLLNLRFGVFFIVGILFCRIYNKESSWIEHLMIFLCLLVSHIVFGDIYRAFGFLFLIIILYLFSFGLFDRLDNKLFRFLAGISYPLFLIHQTIGITILDFMMEKNLNYILSVVFVTLLSIGLAVCIHYLYEVPLMRIVAKKNEKKKNLNIHS